MQNYHFRTSSPAARLAGVLAALLASVGFLVGSARPAAAAADTIPVTVVVKSLTALDNALESDADLYAVLHVGTPESTDLYGKFDTFAVHVDDEDHVELNKAFIARVPRDRESVDVVFEGWDHDNCDSAGPCNDFFDPDDRGDVDPDPRFNATRVRLGITKGIESGCTEGDGSGKIRLCYEVRAFEPGPDSDNDGLLDRWERDGLDMDGDGAPDLDLPGMGAQWDHADLFLELDYETGQAPTKASVQAMKRAFAAAPVFNPDGTPGIRLWMDTGRLVDQTAIPNQPLGSCLDGVDNGTDGVADANDSDCTDTGPRRYLETSTEDPTAAVCTPADSGNPTCLVGDDLGTRGDGEELTMPVNACGVDAAFYAAKRANFEPVRRWVFRYAISAARPATCKSSGGQGEVGGNDFIDFNHDGGTIMHELGHNLNLDHGGDTDFNCKANYVSVMNYDNQFGILRVGGGVILDYAMPRRDVSGFNPGAAPSPASISRGPLPPSLFETDLDDSTVLDRADGDNRFRFVNGKGVKVDERLDTEIDWAANGNVTDSNQEFDINTGTPNPPDCQRNAGVKPDEIKGFDDWLRVSQSMNLRQFGDARDGAINPSPDLTPTLEQLVEMEQQVLDADVATSIVGTPDPVAAGTDVTYQVKVTNHGPDPAGDVTATITLADGLPLRSAPGCSEASGTFTCPLGPLGVGQEKTLTVVAGVPADLVYVNGGPKVLTTTARAGGAPADLVPANNEASASVTAVAVADLSAGGATASGVPAELLIGAPVPVTVDFSLANGGPSSPMDGTLTVGAQASAGGTVGPASQALPVTALATGSPQRSTALVEVACRQPGVQTFTVTGTITPSRPADTDPNPANNTSSVTVSVECVVPIAINIRPGSQGNVSTLAGDNALPVALLSTRAGEYGLPLAFDARTVDVSRLRFGERQVVFSNQGGSVEHQGRATVVDSFEPDDRTKDGDADLRAQFARKGTGLGPADTEACVKGTYVAAGGASYRFFGCDALQLVP